MNLGEQVQPSTLRQRLSRQAERVSLLTSALPFSGEELLRHPHCEYWLSDLLALGPALSLPGIQGLFLGLIAGIGAAIDRAEETGGVRVGQSRLGDSYDLFAASDDLEDYPKTLGTLTFAGPDAVLFTAGLPGQAGGSFSLNGSTFEVTLTHLGDGTLNSDDHTFRSETLVGNGVQTLGHVSVKPPGSVEMPNDPRAEMTEDGFVVATYKLASGDGDAPPLNAHLDLGPGKRPDDTPTLVWKPQELPPPWAAAAS